LQRLATHAPPTTAWAESEPQAVDWVSLRARLSPLWRHVVWASLLFSALSIGVTIRVQVQNLRQDLDRNVRAQRESNVVQDRLRLELAARRRAVVLDQAATQLALSEDVRVERIIQ
jgi:hypothetical protein